MSEPRDMPGGLAVDDLEALWRLLSETLAELGPERDRLFLAKLALLLGHRLGDPQAVAEAIAIARRDL